MNKAASGDDKRRQVGPAHSLGAHVQAFASKIERWNDERIQPRTTDSATDARLATAASTNGIAKQSSITKGRFLDNGEGKICVLSVTGEADVEAPASDLMMRRTVLTDDGGITADSTTPLDKVKGHSIAYSTCELHHMQMLQPPDMLLSLMHLACPKLAYLWSGNTLPGTPICSRTLSRRKASVLLSSPLLIPQSGARTRLS